MLDGTREPWMPSSAEVEDAFRSAASYTHEFSQSIVDFEHFDKWTLCSKADRVPLVLDRLTRNGCGYDGLLQYSIMLPDAQVLLLLRKLFALQKVRIWWNLDSLVVKLYGPKPGDAPGALDHALQQFTEHVASMAPPPGYNWVPRLSSLSDFEEYRLNRHCMFATVAFGTQEATDALAPLRATLSNHVVCQLVRVQNTRQWELYRWERNEMRASGRFQGEVPQKTLFHGTRGADPYQVALSENGLEGRYSSRANWWGRGVYFSESAAVSHIYAHRLAAVPPTRFTLLIVDVLVGHVSSNAPVPATASTQWQDVKDAPDGFDSVSGVVNGSVNYCVYKTHRSVVRYIVQYMITP